MKVFIMTDLEGISGVDNIDMVISPTPEKNHFACGRLMADLNAAVEGCIRAGADIVGVYDGHGTGDNFLKEMLDPRAVQLNSGNWEDFIRQGCDACLEIGCHAKPGTENGFLDHCQSSVRWYQYSVNGVPQGEIAQEALFCGAFGVPFVMVSGDEGACREAKELIANIETAAVKKANGRNRATCLPFDEAECLISEAAYRGVKKRNEIVPYQVKMPMTVRVDFCRTDYCEEHLAAVKQAERVGVRSLERTVGMILHYRDVILG